MQQETWELQQRTARFSEAVAGLCRELLQKRATKRLAQRLSTATTAVDKGYRDVGAAGSREAFITGMSHVARNAKRARTILQDLVALNHVPIETAREPILEAHAFEAIFRACLKTARARRAAARVSGAAEPGPVRSPARSRSPSGGSRPRPDAGRPGS